MESEIGARLSKWRKTLGLTQAAMADRVGVHIGVLKKYEQGFNVPGGEALAAIARTGVDLTWLLTGEGKMQPPRTDEPTPNIDVDALAAVCRRVLDAAGERHLPPEQYARLVAEYYRRALEYAPTLDRRAERIRVLDAYAELLARDVADTCAPARAPAHRTRKAG